MKRNMKQWLQGVLEADRKKAMPVLSFPAKQLLGITVRELIQSAQMQARGMAEIARRVNSLASVSLMDLSVEAEAFGSEVRFSDSEVPTVVGRIVSSPDEADALQVPAVGAGRTGIYVEAIRLASEEISDRPVLAGVIGPFSLAGRLMDVSEAMVNCYDEPEMVHTTLQKCTQFLIQYCLAYKEAGANGVIMAEPLAGLLSPDLCAEFSSRYVGEIRAAVQDDEFLVIYHNCGNQTPFLLDSIFATGCAAYHFGNAVSMCEMLEKAPADTILMGNVDPAGQFRNGTPESVRAETLRVMGECCHRRNFVISSGCDIPPESPWENIDAFFSAVDAFYNGETA